MTFEGSAVILGHVTDDNARRLGEWLRERREELDISLDQAEEETRIRARYLQALETEDFQALPDTVVGRGFLRNYATYLGLDSHRASDLYSVLVAPPEPESLTVEGPSPFASGPFRPVPLHEVKGERSRRGWIAAALVVLVAALALLVWWARPWIADWLSGAEPPSAVAKDTPTEQAVGAGLQTATHTAVPATRVTLTTASSAPTGTEAPLEPTRAPTRTPTQTPSPTPTQPIYTGIFLELAFSDVSWIQVTVDGVREFQGELEAGTYRSWFGEQRIELRIGNAGAVEITLNGQKLGTLGELGEVVDRVFERVGDRVGEATVTPVTPVTPTEGPMLTATASPGTSEVTPTATITLTATGTATP